MTEKELRKLYYLQRELEHIQHEIRKLDLEVGVASPALTGMPKAARTVSAVERIALERTAFYERLHSIEAMIQIEIDKIMKFIYACPDSEVRQIMTMRYIHMLTWEQIGLNMFMARDTARRKVMRYIRKNAQKVAL